MLWELYGYSYEEMAASESLWYWGSFRLFESWWIAVFNANGAAAAGEEIGASEPNPSSEIPGENFAPQAGQEFVPADATCGE
jgi:hypothetical protein